MVKFVRDTIHGFEQRPHYEARELDTLFQRIVVEFLMRKYGKVQFPITTEDLKCLIEESVDDLDQYADLSAFGAHVEGLTEFPLVGRPRVKISEEAHRHENRLRTTLTHEFGHVTLHSYLFADAASRRKFEQRQMGAAKYCKRDAIIQAGPRDWMEWQAGYACGAVLMPKSFIAREIAGIVSTSSGIRLITASGSLGQTLIETVKSRFGVSRDAARVRLSVLSYLAPEPPTKLLAS